jgi:hypothetical protein
MTDLLSSISGIVWGPFVLVPLLLLTGLYFTMVLRGLQFRILGPALNLALIKRKEDTEEGDISHYQALMTALAAISAPATSWAWRPPLRPEVSARSFGCGQICFGIRLLRSWVNKGKKKRKGHSIRPQPAFLPSSVAYCSGPFSVRLLLLLLVEVLP